MPVTIPVSIFLPVTMVLLYMIYILTMTNIMSPMAGTIRTVPMITGAGTVDSKVKRMILKFLLSVIV